jgi:hypothetical protein
MEDFRSGLFARRIRSGAQRQEIRRGPAYSFVAPNVTARVMLVAALRTSMRPLLASRSRRLVQNAGITPLALLQPQE